MNNLESSNQSEGATTEIPERVETRLEINETNVQDELITRGVKLHQAAVRGDWKAAKIIIDEQNRLINSKLGIALYILPVNWELLFTSLLKQRTEKYITLLINSKPFSFFFCHQDELQAKSLITTTRGIQLHQAALRGDWKAAKIIIDEQKDIVRSKITSKSGNALHIAVEAKEEGFVKDLLLEMDREDLALQDKDNNTALHIAAAVGVVEIAEMLVKKNNNLPNILGSGEMTPIHLAALFGHGEMVKCLYSKTNFGVLHDDQFINLFQAIISSDIYDVALWMLKKEENINVLPITRNSEGETALHLMARKPSAISHQRELNWFPNLAHSISNGLFFREAKMRTLAHQLVEQLWKSVVHLPAEEISELLKSKKSRLLFDAAESGNVEFLGILIRSYPDIIWKVDEKSRSIFHIAAIHRQESIFKMIYKLGGIKDLIASYEEDVSEDNLLHLVARLPLPQRLQVVSGAALQMQREKLWFKAVEEIVPRSYIKTKNKEGDTAHVLFTAQHDNLRKEGEKWMKETATACMLVATLIATVVFAAAFTVPGGYDDSTGFDKETRHNNIAGFPRFRKEFWFDIFMVSDSVSLLSSVLSVVIFLSILTSRYAEDDFLTALPMKLVLGLSTLFVSIFSMVFAFTVAMILVREQEPDWSLILVISLASLTVLSYIWLQFRLWFDTLRSLFSAYFSKFLFYRRKSGLFL